MEHFWAGFEKRAGGKAKAAVKVVKDAAKGEGFFGGLKRLGGEAAEGVGKGLDSVGGWVKGQAQSLNKSLPESVSKHTSAIANKISDNPVKSSLAATGLAYGAGKTMGSRTNEAPQYNNYVM